MSEQRESITRRFAVKKKSAYFLAIKITLDTYNLFRNRILEIFFEEILFRREKTKSSPRSFFSIFFLPSFFCFLNTRNLNFCTSSFPFREVQPFLKRRGGEGATIKALRSIVSYLSRAQRAVPFHRCAKINFN